MHSQTATYVTRTAAVILWGAALALGQGTTSPGGSAGALAAPAVSGLESQIGELRQLIVQMQSRMGQMQSETEQLRQELKEAKSQMASLNHSPDQPSTTAAAADPGPAGQVSPPAPEAPRLAERVTKLEEDHQLLESKVNDQYQTKVESSSRNRVKISGLALLNVFSNRGNVDNIDVPAVATSRGPTQSNGSFGATVRQSQLGLEVIGPTIGGARTKGEIQADFFGGFPGFSNGVSTGFVRLRTASFRMDWANTSVIAGQDALFISPLSPTSLASLAEPALSYAGNLWTWIPQLRVEHRFATGDTSRIVTQAGILDPVSGEPPYSSTYRTAQAGERSGQPAYAARIAWVSRAFGSPLSVGVGGYYSRQDWGFNRKVDAWAGTADWQLPLSRWLELSGEFYRGRGLGGLGGGVGRSILYNGDLSDPATRVLGLESLGGWGQLKFRASPRLEFNGAMGQDNPFASAFHCFAGETQSYFYASLARNRSGLVNFIYRPLSDLLFSLEYRRLWSYDITDGPYSIGILF